MLSPHHMAWQELDAIVGTFDAGRARRVGRRRWFSVWRADASPPITVMPVEDGYVVLDGHHRVSVARARGAATIAATSG